MTFFDKSRDIKTEFIELNKQKKTSLNNILFTQDEKKEKDIIKFNTNIIESGGFK